DGRPVQARELQRAYISFSNAPSAEPAHRALFSELRVGAAFPGPALVSMILKCMLSTPEDSFFGGDSGRPSVDCFKLLVDEVEALVKNASAMQYVADHANPLWRVEGGEKEPGVHQHVGFTATLKQHRENWAQSDRATALLGAYRLLRQVLTTVNKLIIRHQESRLYFTY